MKPHQYTQPHMHTLVNIFVYDDCSKPELELYVADAWRVFKEAEERFSLFRSDSELSMVNAHTGQTTQVSAECAVTLADALRFAEQTGNAYNPLYMSSVNPSAVELSIIDGCVRMPVGAKLDLNAIVKGRAIDYALRKLPASLAVMVEAGGDIAVHGLPPGQQSWSIAVRDPRQPERAIAAIPLTSDEAICTSGRYFRGDHIRNTQRQYHAEILSVTVIAPTAEEADALSTALFFYDIADAVAHIDAQRGRGCLIIDEDGELFMSQSIRERLELIVYP